MAAIEELTFTIEEWSQDGNRLIEVLARTASQTIGAVAFKAAICPKKSDDGQCSR